MIVGRLIGWLFIIAALVAAGHDLWGLWDTGHFQISAVGQLWAEVHRGSLLLLEPAITRHVSVWLWQWVVFPILLAPAALTLVVPGILLVWLCRRRDRRRRH